MELMDGTLIKKAAYFLMGTVKNSLKYSHLANVIQSSFGKPSQKTTHYVKVNALSDEVLTVSVQTIVSYGHQGVWRDLERKYVDEAVGIIKQEMKKIEADYAASVAQKEKLGEPKVEPYLTPAPKTITLKLMPSSIKHNLILLSTTAYSEAKTAMFKVDCMIEVL